MARPETRIAAILLGLVAMAHSNNNNKNNNDNNNVVLCNSDRSKCEDFGSSLDLEALSAVNEWWSEISAKGKVGCQAEEARREKEEPFISKAAPFFRTMECKTYEKDVRREPLSFRGKVVENLLQGPGKVKIGSLDVSNIGAQLDDTCFDLSPVMGHMAANITGNFVDGIPHGMIKIDMKDGFILIGTFNNGVLHGFCRLWNENGQLVFAGRVWNGQTKGITWNYREGVRIAFRGEALILSDNTEEEVQGDSAIVLLDSGLFIGGDYMRHNDITANARPVKVKSLSRDACMLSIKLGKMEGTPMAIRPKNNTLEVSFQGFQVDALKCDNRGSWNEDNAGSRLKKWAKNLFEVPNDLNWLTEDINDEVSSDAMKLISEIKQVEGQIFTAKLLDGTEPVSCRMVQGEIRDGVIHGSVRFDFDPKMTPRFPIVNQGVSIIRGYMNNSVLEKVISIQLEDQRVFFGRVNQGALHGPTILLGLRHVFPLAKEIVYVTDEVVSETGFIVNFKNGFPHGLIWHQLIGGGFMHGKLDSHGKFTGSDMAFIYPDMETVIYGSFEDYVMKEGRKSSVIAERCNEYGLKEVRFSEPVGPVMWYSPPTNESYGDGPQNKDPFEEKHMYLANSTIMPWAGEGIFARTDFGADELVCPYSGTIYRNPEERQLYNDHYSMNTSRSDYERRWSKKYSIGVSYTGSTIEIPIEKDYPGTWLPAHGCKINNDFENRRGNSVFAKMEHPRFGLIMSIRTFKPVKAGDEFFVDYGYGDDGPGEFPTDFLWYHEAKKEYREEQRKKKEAEDAKDKSKDKANKKKKGKKDEAKKRKNKANA